MKSLTFYCISASLCDSSGDNVPNSQDSIFKQSPGPKFIKPCQLATKSPFSCLLELTLYSQNPTRCQHHSNCMLNLAGNQAIQHPTMAQLTANLAGFYEFRPSSLKTTFSFINSVSFCLHFLKSMPSTPPFSNVSSNPPPQSGSLGLLLSINFCFILLVCLFVRCLFV